MKKIRQQDDLAQIKFILCNGHFEGSSRKKIFGVFGVLVGISLGLMFLSITMISIEQLNSDRSVVEFVGLIIGFVVAFLLLPTIWLIIIIRNEKIRKKVILWLQDAIKISGYSKNIGTKYWLGIPLIKIQVEFELAGIKFVRTSEREKRGVFDLGRPVGYFSGITKFVDRKIDILYSPKYDQVMVLKDR